MLLSVVFQCTRAPKFHYCVGERLRILYSAFGDCWVRIRVRGDGGSRGRTGRVGHGRGSMAFVVGVLGGNGWNVPILVACILACFMIAASTLVLLVLYVSEVVPLHEGLGPVGPGCFRHDRRLVPGIMMRKGR